MREVSDVESHLDQTESEMEKVKPPQNSGYSLSSVLLDQTESEMGNVKLFRIFCYHGYIILDQTESEMGNVKLWCWGWG